MDYDGRTVTGQPQSALERQVAELAGQVAVLRQQGRIDGDCIAELWQRILKLEGAGKSRGCADCAEKAEEESPFRAEMFQVVGEQQPPENSDKYQALMGLLREAEQLAGLEPLTLPVGLGPRIWELLRCTSD